MTVPILETERLVLRGHTADELDDELALWSDPAVIRYIGGKPFGREDVWSRLQRYAGHWALQGFGFWQVRERATDRFVGDVGLADFKRDLPVSFDGAPEAGWVLAPWSHGKGYATEAVLAALAWIRDAGHARTVCMIDPPNAPSQRVAAKCGYRELTRCSYKGGPVVIFERNG